MKKVVTILMATILAMLTLSGCSEITQAVKDGASTAGEATSAVTTAAVTQAGEPKIAYKIADLSYANIGNVTRIVDRVTISEADMNKETDADLTEFLKALTQKQIKAHSPDALMIFLYCEGDKTDSAFTIAKCTYAPAGKWENTLKDANSGYVGYDYEITINSASERDMLRSLD